MNALGFREIKAWADLKEITLLPWQLDAILELDIQRRIVGAQAHSDAQKEPVSAQPLTAKSMAYIFPGRRKKFDRDGNLLN